MIFVVAKYSDRLRNILDKVLSDNGIQEKATLLAKECGERVLTIHSTLPAEEIEVIVEDITRKTDEFDIIFY